MTKKTTESVWIISDLHSTFIDEKAFNVFLQAYKDAKPDRLIINGDLVDFPTISSHARRIEEYNPSILREYSLQEEIEFTKEKILAPLHKAHPKVPILVRLGNHERRFVRPPRRATEALDEILSACRAMGSLKLENLLELKKYGATLSYKGIDTLWGGKFVLIHGTALSSNRCAKHLLKYAASGTSGHSHKMDSASRQTLNGRITWIESGGLRTIRDVEYLEEGEIPDWTQGFITVVKDGSTILPQQHFIDNYTLRMNGKIYKYKAGTKRAQVRSKRRTSGKSTSKND